MKDILEALIRGAADIIADALITKIKDFHQCTPTEAVERFHHGVASLFARDDDAPCTASTEAANRRKYMRGELHLDRAVSPEELKEFFYEKNGILYHLRDTIYGGKMDVEAGSTPRQPKETAKNKHRQCTVYCKGHRYPRAHIVFALHHGRWPVSKLFHKNFDRLDDRVENLIEASHSEITRSNCVSRNNLVGVKGVSYDAKRGVYRSRIMVDGVVSRLGETTTASEIHEKYCDAASKLHGMFNPASTLYKITKEKD